MLIVFPLFLYAIVASVVALPVLSKARRAVRTSPAPAPGLRMRVAMATCAVALGLHVAAQVIPTLRAHEYDMLMVLVYGWVGPVNCLIGIGAVVLLVLGRRRHSAALLTAAQAAAVSLYLAGPLTMLEAFALGSLGLPLPPY